MYTYLTAHPAQYPEVVVVREETGFNDTRVDPQKQASRIIWEQD